MSGAATDEDASIATGVERFLIDRLGAAAQPRLRDAHRLTAAGNARDAWALELEWCEDDRRRTQPCVMMVKAEGGQLETGVVAEFHALQLMYDAAVPVPRPLWLDDTGDWLGRPFFISALVEGTADDRVLRRDVQRAQQVLYDLATAAARIHLVDWQQRGADLHLPSTTEAHTARQQLELWRDIFERNRVGPEPALVFAFAWLERRQPVAEQISIVHGDLRLGNVLHHEGHLTAVLDWEMVHLGDPVEDLAWAYKRLWSPASLLPFDSFLQQYREVSGFEVTAEHFGYYAMFSEVKHAVISLTAARSFADGETRNLRMADRGAAVATTLAEFFDRLPA